MVAANNTFIHEMLSLCGMENVFAHLTRYPEVSLAQIKVTKPDIMLLSSEPFPFKEKHITELQQAGVNASFELVDGEIFCWAGSRLQLAADYFTQLNLRINNRTKNGH